MGHKTNQLEASDARDLRENAASSDPARRLPSRPRLGAPDDTWSTVIKDVVREAPKTALVITGTVVLTLLSVLGRLIGVLVGHALAAPPPGPPVAQVLEFVFEAAWRTTTKGG